jgi:uroporphyrin-3 C-methyltransferase
MTDRPTDTKDSHSANNIKTLGSPAHPASKKASAPNTSAPSKGPKSRENTGTMHTGRKRGIIGPLAFVLALGATGLAGYSYWHNQQRLNALAVNTQALTSENVQLAENLSETNRQINVLQSQLKRQQQALTTQQRELSEYIDKQLFGMNEQLTALENQAQQLLELPDTLGPAQAISQALELAYRKLNFEQDVPATIALLESVINTYCLPPANAGLTPTCVGLEADRVSLRQVPLPNLNRILQELNGIQTSLMAHQNSMFRNLVTIPEKTPQAGRSFSELPDWRAHLDYMFTSASKFFAQHIVRIHRLDEADPIRLSADQHDTLIQTIVLLIEQGKSACLRGDQLRYTTALTTAADALHQYLPEGADPLNHERLLRTLSKTNLKPELPRLTAAYTVINSTLKTQKTAHQNTESQTIKPGDSHINQPKPPAAAVPEAPAKSAHQTL